MTTASSCRLRHPRVTRGRISRLPFEAVFDDANRVLKFYDYLNMIYNRHRKIESFFINYSKKKNFTKYQCNESVVVTESKIPMKVNYCLRGYVDYKGVFDLNLKAVTLMRKKDAFSMEANVRGFTKDNIDIFTKTVLNGIRYSQNANN